MVEAFIRKHGVTKCPAFGTTEFRDMNLAREHAWRERDRRSWGRKGQ